MATGLNTASVWGMHSTRKVYNQQQYMASPNMEGDGKDAIFFISDEQLNAKTDWKTPRLA